MKPGTSRIGAAGTFYVAGQLAERHWEASPTLGNAPRTDIVAQHAHSQRLIAVQCKTTTGTKSFLLNQGCESPSPPGRDEWFILTALRGPDTRPDFYVMPRNVAAAYIYVGHVAWLQVPGKKGQPHKPNTMRDVEQRNALPYKERWDLLEGPAADVPYWLPEAIFDWAERTGLPHGHPGLLRPDDEVDLPPRPSWLPDPALV